MASVKQSQRMRFRVGMTLIVVGVFATVFVLWNAARRAGSMAAAAASDERQFAQTGAGEKTKVVIEIASAADGTIKGKVLQKKSETVYGRTNSEALVHWNGQAKIVMGKEDDVHAGAVVHVTGTTGKDHSIRAEQIVILTGYVKVE